jgi:uncharacterized integral membrane protein
MEDFRESRGRALPALIAAVVLTLMAFASTTVALMGLAYWMAAGWAIPLGKALMLVAAAGMVLTLLLTAFVVHSLRASFVSFRRSREELERNIAWLQTVLLRSGR